MKRSACVVLHEDLDDLRFGESALAHGVSPSTFGRETHGIK
jgi:hypothetical protein